ncbi:MAG: arginine repressor [Acidimicrobiia bacterium]|nr:arginine repressor [Acidimicrobiia bacterium]
MSTTAARRRVIRNLILDQAVTSQAELVELLEARGIAVTQATVSRDLAVIGATKANDDHYRIGDRGDPDEAISYLGRTIDEFVKSIQTSGNIVVMKTPPGAAMVVASAIDGAFLPEVLGSVGGDDTILVIASTPDGGAELAEKLEQIGANS